MLFISTALLALAGIAYADDTATTAPQANLKKPPAEAPDSNQETQLPEVLVTATKNPQEETKLGSAVSKIDADEINRTQSVDLLQSLDMAPGVFATDAGARGGFATISIRGNRDIDTLVMVDGVRLNTGIFQNADPFLAYAGTNNLQSIEIVRGPQSTLYGSDGIGGVVSMDSLKGQGAPSANVFGEVGSFSSLREGINSQGAFGKAAYSLSYERDDTANDRPNNDLWSNRYALRLDYQILDNLSLRLNFRGLDGHYEEPGSDRPQDYDSNDPYSYAIGQSNLLSAIMGWKVNDIWTQKLTLGAYFERYVLNDPLAYAGNFFTPSLYISNAINYSVDWQNTLQITSNNRTTAGLNFNEFTGHDNTFTNQYISDWAGYLQDEWEVVKHLNLTAGARYDDYELAGDALTYRFTGSYLFPRTDTKIRSSYGTAFQAPSIYELYSNSTFAKGSPGLKPEKSRGWDIGVDQYLLDRRVTLSATYFQNNIRDLIDFVSTSQVTGFYQNRDTAETDGIELAAQLTFYREWKTRISYTYTDSTYTDSGVTRRRDEIPRNHLNLDTSNLFFGKWLVGAGVSFLGGRVDTDYSTAQPTQINLGDYWTARIYSRYNVNDHFAIFARIENVTDSHHEDVLGYPALPIGVYGGINIRF